MDSFPSSCSAQETAPSDTIKKDALPRMVDYGAGKCIPCKKMAPILKELQSEYSGKVEVIFIDVWMDNEAGQKAGIRLIPTQIFFDKSGKEIARHEGYMSKEDILAEWRKHKFIPTIAE
ncbi:MAG: thioredoxin family protein [Calditrichaeota bacterium]|nr:thioredoxin family protein [Calditrichota bacterium]